MIKKDRLRPFEYSDLVRLGNPDGDGGYVVPKQLARSVDVLLSLGLEENWSFDLEMQRRNPLVRVIGVDHSIRASNFMYGLVRSTMKRFLYKLLGNREKTAKYTKLRDHYGDYFRLFTNPSVHVKKMVASDDGGGRISFNAIMGLAAPIKDHSVFLKMDIEGSEYATISQIAIHERFISAITAEFHDLVSDSETFNAAIEELQRAFVIVHIHANNHGGYSQEQDFPDTVEITFVNRSLVSEVLQRSERQYPRPDLDVTNCGERADYALHF